MTHPLQFIVFMVIAWAILFFMHWLVYTPLARLGIVQFNHWPFVLGGLAGSYLFTSFIVRTIEHPAADLLYVMAATWLGILFLLFSTFVVYELVHRITGFDSRTLAIALIAMVGALSLYALVAGRSLVMKEYTVPIVHLDRVVRIVHLSDIHVGTVHQRAYLERVVNETNALAPDLVLITGDLFDGSAPIDEAILEPLNDLSAPAFFSNGNHEEYEGLQRVEETINKLDVELLSNRTVLWDGIELIGVNDRQSLRGTTLDEVLRAQSRTPDAPTILLYHTPSDWNVARAHDVDLMLSGHTHNGQIYPFNLLVRLFFTYVNGIYEHDGKYLHVTPGTGTWGPPMRLGSRNQVTLIVLQPQ